MTQPSDAGSSATETDTGAGDQRPGPAVRPLTALPRQRRVLVLAATAVVLAAVVATLGITLSGDDRPVPNGTMPTLGSQFATPPTAPAEPGPATPADLPVFTGAPLWTVPLPAGTDGAGVSGFAVTDAGYLLAERDHVTGLDKAGRQLWRFTQPAADYLTVRVTGPHALVGYSNPDEDRWPQPQVVVALDTATGRELWRETEASLWSATTDTVYLSVCYGGQNNRVGDCTLSARDPADNTVRWQIPTYASSRVENESHTTQAAPTPPYLLVGAYATGADTYVLSAHAPAGGATLGRGYDGGDGRVGSIEARTARTVVTGTGGDDNPADGCTTLLTGFTVSGATQTWQYTARTAKQHDGKHCGTQPESVNNGRLGVTAGDGAPSVLNLDTGAVEWSAPPGGQAIAASDTTLVAAETGEDTTELVTYRVGTAAPAWRAPFPGTVDGATVTITATTVLVTAPGSDAVGYDLKTGEAWTYGGTVARQTDEWFAVCTETTCTGYAIT